MTEREAVPILCRWIAELQEDLADTRMRIAELEARVLVADDMRWWMDRHTPDAVIEMGSALEALV